MDFLYLYISFQQNPVGTMPVIWNDLLATPALKTRLLFDIKRAQSAGVQRMVDAFRSLRGDLPVVAFSEDTFHIKCCSSLDPMVQVRGRDYVCVLTCVFSGPILLRRQGARTLP
jgi:hypothetical protein